MQIIVVGGRFMMEASRRKWRKFDGGRIKGKNV